MTNPIDRMLSQIVRFTLPPSLTISAPAFLELRQTVSAAGAAAQYFGYITPTKLYPLPKNRHEICWTIQWPKTCDPHQVLPALREIATGNPTSLLFKLADNQLPHVEKALEAPVCEFATIRLSNDAPLSDIALQTSMHKTYTDTYKIRGFTGGHWAYAINTNETSEAPSNTTSEELLVEGERRLAVYYLGWESIELHQDATKTPEFAEEIDKLMPYFGPGTGAWYVMFKKHE